MVNEGLRRLIGIGAEVLVDGLEKAAGQLTKDAGKQVRDRALDMGRNAARNMSSLPGSNPDYERDPNTGWPIWVVKQFQAKQNVFPIYGERGLGKTALSLAIAEYRRQPLYVLDAPPKWVNTGKVISIDSVHDVKDVPPGSTFLVDDAARYIGARTAMSKDNRKFVEIMNEVRHREITVIVNAPLARTIEILAMEFTAVFYKDPVMTWESLERPELRPVARIAAQAFKGKNEMYKKQHVIMFKDPEHFGELDYSPPAWYASSYGMSQYRTG